MRKSVKVELSHYHRFSLFITSRNLPPVLDNNMQAPSTATALTALLNSLHTHLQSQTQLLPTLHAQLGLPPSALEDELRSLQTELLRGVELQVDKRRKEVEKWMEQCEDIENQCMRYTKALGGNIKATGSSIGELKKEHSLPRRYELISEYQEKLRQVRILLLYLN